MISISHGTGSAASSASGSASRSRPSSDRETMPDDLEHGRGEVARGASGDWSGDPDDERPAKDPFEGARTDPGEASVIIEGDISPQGGARIDALSVECPFCGAPATRPCVMQTKLKRLVLTKGPHSARMNKARQAASP